MSSFYVRYTCLSAAIMLTTALVNLPQSYAQSTTPAAIPAIAAPAVITSLPQPSAAALQPVAAETMAPAPGTTTTTTVTTPSVTSTQTTTAATPPANMADMPANGVAMAPATTPALTAEQQKQAAVQAILGDQVRKVAPPLPTTPAAMNASDLLARGVVVTPKAEEIVLVKKGARANTDRAVYTAADRAYVSKDFGASSDLYDRILKKSPSNKTALYGKALALQKSGRDDEALKIYERLSLLDPTNVNATANYMTLLRKKDPQRALSRLQNLESQYPDRPALQGQIGMVYADMNDTPNAIRAFTRATALDPSNPVLAFNLGALYDRLGNDQKAGDYYRTALQIAGDNPSKANLIASDAVRDRLRELND